MAVLDVEKFDKYCELEDQYIAKYKREDIPDYMIFPTEFYELNDYDSKIKLLEQALRENIRVEQTEAIRQMHIQNLDLRIEENLREAAEKRK